MSIPFRLRGSLAPGKLQYTTPLSLRQWSRLMLGEYERLCHLCQRRLYRLHQACTDKNKKLAYVKHPNESQGPTVCLDEGPAGGFWPLQKMLRRFGPPQASVDIPVHPMSQSDANSFVPVGAMVFAQSHMTLESILSN